MINKLLVQEYLETHSFGELIAEHGVYASFSKSGHKFSLNYDQIEAKEGDPLAQECRGLILSCETGVSLASQALTVPGQKTSYNHLSPGKTVVLAYPMKRFFNYGQGCAANINWTDPKLSVLEKLDGTLCIVYWDPFTSQWCVATRSVSEADLLMDNGLFTFRSLFEKAVEETTHGLPFDQLTNYLNKDITYCFELTTPYNRIVVNYSGCGITLLSARKLHNHKEVDPNSLGLEVASVPIVQAHSYNSVTELIDWVSSLNPMEHEGVVVRDGDFNRIKVKNAAYVAYNKVRDTLATSERNCVELILAEKDDDVISFLPEEIVKNLQKIKLGVQVALKKHDEAYRAAKAQADAILMGDKKTFAILITKDKSMWNAPFFQMFDGKAANMKEFIMQNRKDGTWGNSFLDRILELSKHS